MNPTNDLADIDARWNYDDPAGSEAAFRALLPGAPAGSERQVVLLTQIARAQGLQRHFDAAHRTLDEADTLLMDEMHRGHIRSLLERGRTYNSGRQPDQAEPLFLAALDAAQRAQEDGLAVDAAHMLAIAAPEARQKLEWNLKALALARESSQPAARKWLGSLYNNLGWTFHDQGDYARALEFFEQALEFRREQPAQAAPISIARWCVARCWRSLGRYEEALAEQRALEAAHAAAGSTDGFVQEEIAENLLALGQAEDARPYFAQAYAALAEDAWLREGEPERLERLRELGEASG